MCERCARCGKNITNEFQVESQLYSPHQQHLLCEPCGDLEEAEVERVGHNNIPELIAMYKIPI